MHLLLAVALATSSSAASLLSCLMFRRCILPCYGAGTAPYDDDKEQHPRRRDPPPAANSKVADEVQRFSWEKIEKLTGGFTAAVIGLGGFSTVYLGRLPDSRPAAFKVQHSSERLYRAFLQERDVLLRVRHPSIVRLLGYSDDRGEPKRPLTSPP